jgi:hypothetical protein
MNILNWNRDTCVPRAIGLFALLWIVARAAVQSVTIDEADTFLAYVAPPFPTHWSGSANNQLLNSLLMRLFTSIFGVAHLSVRAPALIGAAIYIVAAIAVARHISDDWRIQWPLLTTLIYNPFVMDHLVAARGYSLALGLLMAAIACAGPRPRPALASLCAGLSFTANFSFVFVDVAVIALLFLPRTGWRPRAIAACIAPGLAVALFLAGSVLWNWPKNQFVYGASSLGEMMNSVLRPSLYEINPYLVNPPMARAFTWLGQFLFPLVALVCLIAAARPRRPAGGVAGRIFAIGIATVAAHWLLFRLAHVLLPKDRTAIFLAPLFFLMAGALASESRGHARGAGALALALTSIYFVFCLRLNYFREWKWDADDKELYAVVAWYSRTYGVTDIFPNWRYVAALNYYRAQSGRDSLPTLESHLPPYSATHDLYVMFFPTDEEFLKANGLRVVYYGRVSESVVAIRPEVDRRRAAAASCNGGPPGRGSTPCS